MKKNESQESCGFKHPFSYRGETYTLSKRKLSKAAPWYIRVVRNGKLIKRCLKTPDAAEAESRAKGIIERADKGQWAELAKMKSRKDVRPEAIPGQGLTLGQVFACYSEKVTKNEPISRKSVYRTWSSWVSILKRTNPGIAPKAFPIVRINEDLARQFGGSLVEEYLKDVDVDRAVSRKQYRAVMYQEKRDCRKKRIWVPIW